MITVRMSLAPSQASVAFFVSPHLVAISTARLVTGPEEELAAQVVVVMAMLIIMLILPRVLNSPLEQLQRVAGSIQPEMVIVVGQLSSTPTLPWACFSLPTRP